MAILLFFKNDKNIVLNFPAAEKVVPQHIFGSVLLANSQVSFIQLLVGVQLLVLFQPQLPML